MAWRKSWSKMNIYGKNGDGDCSKRKLLPEERSVLDDYLDLAEISPVRGLVCIAKNIGYTQEQLSQILNTPLEIINKSEKKLAKMEVITIDNKRVISIVNWKHYQSEYERQLPYRITSKGYKDKLQEKVTKNTSVSTSTSISTSTSDLKEKYMKIWNDKMPWKITDITTSRRTHLTERLKEPVFTENYSAILDKILASDFLTGRKPSITHPNFKADFDWLIKNDQNYVKVFEGKYDNRIDPEAIRKQFNLKPEVK